MNKEIKWYKRTDINNCPGGWLLYVKGYKNTYDDTIIYSERIDDNSKEVYNKNNECYTKGMIEISPKEIQQYLPDNHPDKIKINMKQQKAKPFAIFGSKPLLKAIWEDLLSIGYINNSLKYNPVDNYKNLEYVCTNTTVTPKTIEEFKILYAGNVSSNRTLAQSCEIFELPTQYNEALEFAKQQLSDIYWKSLKKLPFGNLEFTIHKEKQFAKCDMGVITKEEIQSVITYWDTDIKLLGYSMEICLNKRPIPKPEWNLKFGCCEGTIEQAKTILKAFD